MPVPLIPLIAAGAQAGYGLYQTIKGNRAKRRLGDQPTYDIPAEVLQNQRMAQQMSTQGLPEAQRQLYQQNIARSGQLGLNALSDRKAGIAGIGNIVQAQNDAYGRLLAQDSQARLANILRYQQMNNVVAGYRDKAWQYNKLMPWQRQYQEATNLQGAGAQNIGGALGTAATVGMNYNSIPPLLRSRLGPLAQRGYQNSVAQNVYGGDPNAAPDFYLNATDMGYGEDVPVSPYV